MAGARGDRSAEGLEEAETVVGGARAGGDGGPSPWARPLAALPRMARACEMESSSRESRQMGSLDPAEGVDLWTQTASCREVGDYVSQFEWFYGRCRQFRV